MSPIAQHKRIPAPVQGQAEVEFVRLSPRGNRIAFVLHSGNAPGIYAGDPGDPVSALRLVEARRHSIDELAWSPDAAHLAYRIGAPLGAMPQVAWASSTAPGEISRKPGAAFAWTPGGQALIVADVARKLLMRYAIPSGKPTELTELHDDMDPGFPPRIAVSPDGARIAFTSGRAGEDISELIVIERDGKRIVPTPVTEIPGASVQVLPFWSPSGPTLAFFAVHEEQQKTALIVLPRLDLEGEGLILYESTFVDPPVTPAWSPSGKSIAFFCVDEEDRLDPALGPCPAPSHLVLLDAYRESFVAITKPGEIEGQPWFLDDRTLVVDGAGAAYLVTFAESP
jgi:dipeptidyl aminopeptidase/acylaminoacyl peptidase